MCTGLSLNCFVPISVYPRWNFLLLAADQLVNHLDKLSIMSDGAYKPKVIIRVAVGVREPIDPQEQHVGDFSDGFAAMLKTVNVVKLTVAEEIFPAYKYAYERTDGVSTILVEQHQS
jgi:pyruvate/2-oxoglutarate/acetoin dehydrogenase E1 component